MTESTAGSMIDVTAWADVEALPEVLDSLGEQFAEIIGHATGWVCQRDGFEPSPVCVLAPLAEVLEPLRSVFEDLGRHFAHEWEAVRAGVVIATAELQASDRTAAATMPEVA